MPRRPLTLNSYQEAVLLACILSNKDGSRIAHRAWAVLLFCEGLRSREIARLLMVPRNHVQVWLERFAEGGIDTLLPLRLAPTPRARMSSDHISRLHTAVTQGKVRSARSARSWMELEMAISCPLVGMQRLLQRLGHTLADGRPQGLRKSRVREGKREDLPEFEAVAALPPLQQSSSPSG